MADDEPPANGGDSPTKVSESQSVSASSQFAIPSARVLCLFMDGGVGLYDLGRRRWNFLREKVSNGLCCRIVGSMAFVY